MDSGGTHKHIGKIDLNKYMEYADMLSTGATGLLHNYCKSLMVGAKAFPVHVDEDTASAAVSACPFRIDMLLHYDIKWRRVNIPKKKDRVVTSGVAVLPGPYSYQ